jgi:hypothetical protein
MQLPSYLCVWCNLGMDETLTHLFITCPFTQSCWLAIQIVFTEVDPFLALEEVRAQLNVPFFMDIIITFCWSIWMQRNDLIFKGIPLSVNTCFRNFKKEFALVILRAKSRHKVAMLQWLEALL